MTPFGYSETEWERDKQAYWKCPKCLRILTTDLGWYQIGLMAKDHSRTCNPVRTYQKTLYGDYMIVNIEVKKDMKIPQSVIESGATKSGLQFIKAAQLTPPATPGETIEFTMNGDVETNGQTEESKVLYSVPVSAVRGGTKLQGQYSLNKTSLKILVTKLGDETEKWTGARFTAFIGPTRNPRTQTQTLGFSILADSVRPPGVRSPSK